MTDADPVAWNGMTAREFFENNVDRYSAVLVWGEAGAMLHLEEEDGALNWADWRGRCPVSDGESVVQLVRDWCVSVGESSPAWIHEVEG